jgi:hypothetical protein
LTGSDIWKITLGTVADVPDLSEGLSYSLSDGEAKRIPSDLLKIGKLNRLEATRFKRKIVVDSKVAKTVMENLAKDKIVAWTYATTTPGEVRTARFSTAGLSKAVAWVACKQ